MPPDTQPPAVRLTGLRKQDLLQLGPKAASARTARKRAELPRRVAVSRKRAGCPTYPS
jgi:hypothetical protein